MPPRREEWVEEPYVEVELTAEQSRTLRQLGIPNSRLAQQALNRMEQTLMLDDDSLICEHDVAVKRICGIPLREINLSNILQEAVGVAVYRMAGCGMEMSLPKLAAFVSEIAEEHGFYGGVPLPSVGERGIGDYPMVMAEGVPMREVFMINQEYAAFERSYREHVNATTTEAQLQLRLRNVRVRNSWNSLGDQTVCVVETDKGPMAYPQWHGGLRLRKLINGIEARSGSALSAGAEIKAMESLKKRITRAQWDTYVLDGAFMERSPRSDLHYMFRKGYPTLAISYHGELARKGGKVIAALCLHPMGYYSGTHAGLMAPTDEVTARLLLMRTDERRFWAKSGQWKVWDTRSGV